MTYADYTASGRALTFIEDVVRSEVLPLYANTYTEGPGAGRRTTRLRENARAIIRDSLGGDDDTLVIFTGSGATGAIDKLMANLNLRIPNDLDAAYHLGESFPQKERPAVFVGPFEHHSNEPPMSRPDSGTCVPTHRTPRGARLVGCPQPRPDQTAVGVPPTAVGQRRPAREHRRRNLTYPGWHVA